jgi:methylmalonyl-CoA mutase N-terminal domain/subunit
LPTEKAVTLALLTQQVLAQETGVTNTVDPLGGGWFIESLTRKMCDEAHRYFAAIGQRGGMLAAIESGFFRRAIAESAFAYQREVDAGRKLIVGVNAFQQPDTADIELLQVSESIEQEQITSLRRVKADRSRDDVERTLQAVRGAAHQQQNLMPALIEAAKARVTVGEAINAMADVFGRHTGAVV